MGTKSINTCVTCGHKLRFFDSFCPACGTTRHIQCPACGNIYNSCAPRCPACGSVKMSLGAGDTFFSLLVYILIAFVFISAFVPIFVDFFPKNKETYNKSNFVEYKNHSYLNENLYYEITSRNYGKEIDIQGMLPFSGLSAQNIIELRKHAVEESPIFRDLQDYEPSREVFDIADYLPWIGALQAACVGTEGPNYQIGEGESRESLMILNPELMLHPLIPTMLNNSPDKCDESYYFIPTKVVYHKDINTITTHIDISTVKEKMGYIPHPYFLETANPRDLGYNAIFATDYYHLKFDNQEDNVSLNISEPRGFWHRGFACGLPDGCNNYSPRDTRFEIRITKLPAAIRVKLWKKMPRNALKRADLTYEIVFE